MNRLDGIAIATALATTPMCIVGFRSFAFDYYADQMLSGSLPLGIAVWALATYGSLIAVTASWRCAMRLSRGAALWLHACFLPCALGIFWLVMPFMLALICDPDFDASIAVARSRYS